MSRLTTPPLSLYVHFPWCVRKCPYCDFNSHTLRGSLPEQEYVAALLTDLAQDLLPLKAPKLHSIFLGGGTPSLFSPDSLARLLAGIRQLVPWNEPIEITLEAHPGTVESGKFHEFRALGINRLSLGIQSFQDDKLKALGRIHTAREAIAAVETARLSGFANINLDLMFGLPQQTLDDALADITTAVELNPTHISFYQLTLEPNTLFAKYPPQLPEEDQIFTIQQACQEVLEAAGYAQYEISAYAWPGFQCQHNLNYWRFGDYLGIGAGAHGKFTEVRQETISRSWKVRYPIHYMAKANTSARLAGKRVIRDADKPLEFLLNALRLKEGFSPSQFEHRTGLPFTALEPSLEPLFTEGLLCWQADRIACTAFGWNLLDTVLERFLPKDQSPATSIHHR